MFWPVMYAAPSEHRNEIVAAISSLVPYRFNGTAWRRSSVVGRLSIQPGRTLFIRILNCACVSQKIFVNAANPARKTAEVGNISLGSKAHAEEMLTITPPP